MAGTERPGRESTRRAWPAAGTVALAAVNMNQLHDRGKAIEGRPAVRDREKLLRRCRADFGKWALVSASAGSICSTITPLAHSTRDKAVR
jgi:hypothetical protein